MLSTSQEQCLVSRVSNSCKHRKRARGNLSGTQGRYNVNNMVRKILYRRKIDHSSHLDQRFISQRMFHYIYEINLYTRGASHKGKRSILITIRGHSPLSMRYYHIIYEKYLYIRDASHKHNKSLLISIIGPLSTLHEMILFINKR